MSADQLSKQSTPVPSFFSRWILFFRYFPENLFRLNFFYGVLSNKHPVLWNNVMEAIERRHRNLLKLKQLEPIAAATKVFPDFQLTKTHCDSRSYNPGIHQYYKSAAEAAEVKSFYVSNLQADGWVLENRKHGWYFKKQKLTISVIPAKDGKYWNYLISHIWEEQQH